MRKEELHAWLWPVGRNLLRDEENQERKRKTKMQRKVATKKRITDWRLLRKEERIRAELKMTKDCRRDMERNFIIKC